MSEKQSFEDILYEKRDGIARVTINRPAVFNAYSSRTLRELATAFRECAWDDSIAALVLTGVGEDAFCTGSDAHEFSREFLTRPRNLWKQQGLLMEALSLFRQAGKPTIARINGVVAGGGNDWNLAADIAVAAERARFRFGGTRIGLVDAFGSSQWLPLVVGERRARELLLTGEELSAAEAFDLGLVNQVVPYSDLDRAVQSFAHKLTQNFPESTRYTRQQLDFWKDLAWSLTAGHARDWLAVHATSWEPYEGIQAFIEKRPADYAGLRRRAASGQSSEFLWGPPTRTCENCGAKGIPERFQYCGKCGAKLE